MDGGQDRLQLSPALAERSSLGVTILPLLTLALELTPSSLQWMLMVS